ncbi:MAG TPA: hypothetical protein VH134_05560 [Candidatus Dormibacteraeota bacterium]|jgi:hypothetical protein|nr:hypothetical protein [Candidatus Dormibacteraeota bacterium]
MAALPDLASRLVRASLDAVGPALATTAQRRDRRRAAATVVRAIGGSPGSPIFPSSAPHPLLPSAVRVERSRRRAGNSLADQVAVTLWFREPPQLPGPGGMEGGGSELSRLALRVGIGLARAGAGLAATAAIGAATVAAQRLEAARQPARIASRPPRDV